LPQNSVITMTLAGDGYLWLGTLSGLVRFDGVRFPVFDANNTPELRSGQIVHLFEDSQGNLWIGTLGLRGRFGSAQRHGHQPRYRSRGTRRTTAICCEDEAGAVWLYTANGELCRYRKGRMDVFNMEANRPSYRRSVIRVEQGRILVGTDQHIYVVAPTGNRDPKDLPIEKTNQVGQLDFLLSSRRGGYWRMADGQVQRWTEAGPANELGPYPWSSGTGSGWPHVASR
jgi:ligand-binding sensor domain-containing protein